MTPKQILGKGYESGHQRLVFAWSARAEHEGVLRADAWLEQKPIDDLPIAPLPMLKWLHAIPNGGSRGDDAKSRAIRGAMLKAEGVKDGISDMFLPLTYPECCGLYIELKSPNVRGAIPSANQKEFGEFAIDQGYKFYVCYGYIQAIQRIKEHLLNYMAYSDSKGY